MCTVPRVGNFQLRVFRMVLLNCVCMLLRSEPCKGVRWDSHMSHASERFQDAGECFDAKIHYQEVTDRLEGRLT
jgi:hypothetical protein